MIGTRWVQLEGEKSHPSGIVGPPDAATMPTPGVGRLSAANPTRRVPIRVPLRYAAADGVQKASGANISQMPTSATAHRARANLGDSDANDRTKTASPDRTSLQASALPP